MMDSYSDIRQAIAANNLDLARDLLRPVLKEEPDSAEVWYLAALAARNPAQRRAFLEKVIELDPLHAQAANALYAASIPAEQPRPTRSEYLRETTTEVTVPPEKRLLAWGIDAVINAVMIIGSLVVLTLFFAPALPEDAAALNAEATRQGSVFLFLALAIPALYYVISLTQMHGQTPGKRLLGLRVVKRSGAPLTAWDAFLRCYIGYLLSMLAFGIGFVWIVIDARQQGWHDMVADTLVVTA